MERALSELKERLGKLTDLRRTEGLLTWDMTVYMPPGGAPTRAAQLATLEEIIHTIYAHPTLSEAALEATLAALGQAIHI